MKILLKKDYRRFNYQKVFGSTTIFLPTLLVDAGFLDKQNVGAVDCTAFTADKVKSGETGKRYDHTWLWAQMMEKGKTSSGGASPQDAFAMAVKGQKVVPTGEIDTSVAYFQVDEGQYDFFTNTKSAIQKEYNSGKKRPVGCGTFWYAEWNVGPNGVMPEGKFHISDHEWLVCGWDEEHPNCFKIDAHMGYHMYMPQNTFNKAMDATYGSVGLTLAETSQEVIDFQKANSYSLIQSIIDKIFNTLKVIQAQINALKTPPTVPETPIKDTVKVIEPEVNTKIPEWAEAIKAQEGAKPEYCNPGNLKVSSLTKQWGASNGFQATDGGWIAKFPTYNHGFTALCNFLTLGCRDELLAFHNARTLQKFMEIYAGNPPQGYINAIGKELGVPLDTDISSFLT